MGRPKRNDTPRAVTVRIPQEWVTYLQERRAETRRSLGDAMVEALRVDRALRFDGKDELVVMQRAADSGANYATDRAGALQVLVMQGAGLA